MRETIHCHGRQLSAAEWSWLQNWIAQHRDWSRHRLAKELCRHWNWRTANGQLKTFAARSFLLKLEQRRLGLLPPIRVALRRDTWVKPPAPTPVEREAARPVPASISITTPLSQLKPLTLILPTPQSVEERWFAYYLGRYHYLGFTHTVGENLKYLVRDRHGHDLACVLFGSAAWKTSPRDAFIGWSDEVRQRNVNLLTNNTRFLILPWGRVPHLASHILGRVLKRLGADWQYKYAHPIHLVETFVQRNRFHGTCYRAANWICVGQTKGRSRQDRYNNLEVPIKDIYLYPLNSNFRTVLCDAAP